MVGRAIRWARMRVALNASEFARKLGIHRSWLSRIEQEQRDLSFQTVLKAADVCGMSIDRLRLGRIPDHLQTMPKKTRETLRAKFTSDFELIDQGRYPSANFVAEMASAMRMSPDEMCYG